MQIDIKDTDDKAKHEVVRLIKHYDRLKSTIIGSEKEECRLKIA